MTDDIPVTDLQGGDILYTIDGACRVFRIDKRGDYSLIVHTTHIATNRTITYWIPVTGVVRVRRPVGATP